MDRVSGTAPVKGVQLAYRSDSSRKLAEGLDDAPMPASILARTGVGA
ncbi:MAG TPA: hypothetical protein VHT97_07210 [Acidimicrobiales bacterium]|nr:hypothetical protein [Acidimicrobiales bacterium]